MAGIGFELKKLFQKRGLAATAKAYGYAGVICTGPMLLGIVLLVGIAFICDHTGATRHNRELLNCMITYTLLASLTVTSFFSMVVTRYIADMLYEERHEAVLSSFWGSTAILLVVGGIMYGIFLLFSGINLIDQFLCLEFFGELIVTWNAMSYLTAIKDYKGILISFITAVAVSVHFSFYAGWISSFRLRLQACSRTSDYLHILLSCGADRSVYMFRDYFMVHRIMMYLR